MKLASTLLSGVATVVFLAVPATAQAQAPAQPSERSPYSSADNAASASSDAKEENQQPRITPVATTGPYGSTNPQLYDILGRYHAVGATLSF